MSLTDILYSVHSVIKSTFRWQRHVCRLTPMCHIRDCTNKKAKKKNPKEREKMCVRLCMQSNKKMTMTTTTKTNGNEKYEAFLNQIPNCDSVLLLHIWYTYVSYICIYIVHMRYFEAIGSHFLVLFLSRFVWCCVFVCLFILLLFRFVFWFTN